MSVAWPKHIAGDDRYCGEIEIRQVSVAWWCLGQECPGYGNTAFGGVAPNSGKLRWHFINGFARIRLCDMLCFKNGSGTNSQMAQRMLRTIGSRPLLKLPGQDSSLLIFDREIRSHVRHCFSCSRHP